MAIDLISGVLRETLRVVKKKGLIKIYPIGGYCGALDNQVNERDKKVFKETLKEIGNLHKEDKKLTFKITEMQKNPRAYDYLLEIRKNL